MKRELNKFSLIVITYLYIPLIIFLGGWLKAWIAIPSILIVLVGMYSFIKQDKPEVMTQKISRGGGILPCFMLHYWVYMGLFVGTGRICQSSERLGKT